MVGMWRLLCRLFISFVALSFLLLFFSGTVFASNAPDFHNSSLQAITNDGAGQAPADGKTVLKVTVTMKDTAGNPLSGETVSIACPDDTTLVITPAKAVLGGDGKATFNTTAVNVGNYSINVINNTQNVTLTSLGKITFYSASCNDTPPGSAPKLISAIAISTSKILLKWTQATDPVTYYLLAYGTSSGQYIYGSANIGGREATSYVVGELAPNKKYYFKIRAGNGCSPGSFSNEISGSTVLATITLVPTPTIMVISTPMPKISVVSEKTPEPVFLTPTPEPLAEKPTSPLVLIGIIVILGILLISISLFFYLRKH